MFQNIRTSNNGWSSFTENLRVVAITLPVTNSYIGIILQTCMFQNIKTSYNGWSNFLENLRVVAITLPVTNSYKGIILQTCMFQNIRTSDNGWSNFTENLRVVAIKMLELNLHNQINQFTFILYDVWVRCYVDIFKLASHAQYIYGEVYSRT